MSDKINKEDIKKVILTYVKDTKQIEKNKFAEDKGMRRIMLMSFNANASNLKLFADCFTDLYLSVIDEMNIQKELDRCITIRNEKAQKGFFKVGGRKWKYIKIGGEHTPKEGLVGCSQKINTLTLIMNMGFMILKIRYGTPLNIFLRVVGSFLENISINFRT